MLVTVLALVPVTVPALVLVIVPALMLVIVLALVLVTVPALVLVPEGGGVYSRSISLGVATSLAEDSEYNAELEGAEPPKYRISRAVKTVKDLWRE